MLLLSRPTVPPYFFPICVLELPWCEKNVARSGELSAGSYPCHPTPDALKPLLRMGLLHTGREGGKFWKLKKESIMRITCHSREKNKSLRKLPPSLPVWVGGFIISTRRSSRSSLPCSSTAASTRTFAFTTTSYLHFEQENINAY
jgi:hypothetical protein